jgi:hypothetical protein
LHFQRSDFGESTALRNAEWKAICENREFSWM